MLGKIFLILISIGFHNVFGADPCYDIGPDPETGNYAVCVQESSCVSEPVAMNACPSHPSDYSCCFHKDFPGREHRGTWIATVDNIDWPKSPTSSVAVQQEELRGLVDRIAEAGLNAIYFQVRPAGDALYQSDIEPWSKYITASQGTPPSPLWDPLQFVIEYCKPLNIEVHAWINPYRANLSPNTIGLAPNHMAMQFPEYAYPFDTYLWMDPGAIEVQNRTYSVAIDLVTRYDLDGLHMDDYFYPYPVTGVKFPDEKTYNDYIASGGTLDLDDWRRDNVNQLVKRLNDGVHEAKPWVKFSISPFGIYRPGHEEGMPSPIAGFDQYSQIYCDPKKWMLEGWVDVLIPQLYWLIDPPAQSYPILLDWWVATSQNPHLRHVYAGNYLTRVEIDSWPWYEIRAQIDISREPANRNRGSWGNVQFSAKMFRDDFGGIIGQFKTFIYPLPAFQPICPWLSNETYAEIKNMHPTVHQTASGFSTINVSVEKTNVVDGLIYKIGIYHQLEGQWKLVKIIPAEKINHSIHGLEMGTYAATFINRFGQESKKSVFKVE